jgi:hypothetical protein
MKSLEYISLMVLAGACLYAIVSKASLSPLQRGVKVVLHLLLLVCVYILIRNPFWNVGNDPVLVYSNTVPKEAVSALSEELKLKKVMSASHFFSESEVEDEVMLFGQDFTAEQLSHLAGKTVDWRGFFPEDRPQELKWKANLRRGDQQKLEGRISLNEEKTLKLIYGTTVLDSVHMGAGYSRFSLKFPVFTEGRTAVELWVGAEKSRDIAFFARAVDKQRVGILEEFPDIEHRLLAEWLGKRGYEVSVSTPVAKGEAQQARINNSSGTDLIITSTARVRPGTAALVLQGREVGQVNRSTGTAFSLNAGSEEVEMLGDLKQFKHKAILRENQHQVGSLPVYIEKKEHKIGVSLMTETFPAKLSGDSVLYDRIWTEIMAAMSRPDSLLVEGPVYAFQENGLPSGKAGVATYFPVDTGWVEKAPFGELYVESDPAATVATWVKNNAATGKVGEETKRYLPEHWKFLAILLSLALLWLEPKFKY